MKKSWASRDVIKKLKENGWYHFKTTGDHYHFKHEEIKGKVTVPHPRKDLRIDEVSSIGKQSGIDFN